MTTFSDPSLVKLSMILDGRAVAIEVDIQRTGEFLDPARVAALSEVAAEFRKLAKALRGQADE